MVPFDGKYNTSNLMKIVCSIFRHLRDIRKSNKLSKFELENKGQGQGEQKPDLLHDKITFMQT